MFKEGFPKQEKEKTKEELLEEFKDSLKEHGIEGVEVRIENNQLIIEQNLEEGIGGLSKSNSSVWLRPNQNESEPSKENDDPETNSKLDFRKEDYLGLTFGRNEAGKKTISFDANHPVVALANLLGKNDQVCLPGQFNRWGDPKYGDPKQLEFNEKTGAIEGVIEGEKSWDENKKAECKISIYAISEIEIIERNGIKKQIMKINLGEENKEE